MKVWYITMQFPVPSETFAVCDVLALSKAGVDVSVHSLKKRHPYAENLINAHHLFDLPMTHGTTSAVCRGFLSAVVRPTLLVPFLIWIFWISRKKPVHIIKCLALTPRVFDVYANIKREKPDVVHIFWGHFPSLVGYLLKKKAAGPVVSLFLGAYDLATRFEGSWEVAKEADVVWTHAQCNVPDIVTFGVPPEKIQVCHRGIDLSSARCPADVSKIKRRIVCAGRLIEAKGVDEVLRSFQKVHKEWTDASLVLLGDGPEKNRLEDLASRLGIDTAVTFRGHVNHSSVFDEMFRAEVFVMMSKSERLPNVVKEAMACGCVCIVTETPSIGELIHNGQTGYVVPYSVNDVAEKINDVFSDTSRMASMVKAALDHVSEDFNVENSMARYRKVWTELL